MRAIPDKSRKSLKKQMVQLLDQYLLGYISAKDLKKGAVPMLTLSASQRGRKNYIEKYLMEIAGKSDKDLSRDYVYRLRETITGDVITSEKDRTKVFKRSLRKLIERLVYEEIESDYFVTLLYELMFDYDAEVNAEKEIRSYFEKIQKLTKYPGDSETILSSDASAAAIIQVSLEFYDSYYKGLWDE